MTSSPAPRTPHAVNCRHPQRTTPTGGRGGCHPECASRWTDTDPGQPTNPSSIRMLGFIPATAKTPADRTCEIAALVTHYINLGEIASWHLEHTDISYPLTDFAGTDPVITGAPLGGWVDELAILHRVTWPADAPSPRFLRHILTGDIDSRLLSMRALSRLPED